MGQESHLFRTREAINGEWVFCRSRTYSQPGLNTVIFTLEDAPSLVSCSQELDNQHTHFLHHRNWFGYGQASQDDPMRLNSLAFGTTFGSEIGFLSVATKLWVHTAIFRVTTQNTLVREKID